MNQREIRPVEKEIMERFFLALHTLKWESKIRGIKPFCLKYGLNAAAYFRLQQYVDNGCIPTPGEKQYRSLDFDAPSYLVRDYNVNAEWLLTGEGDMFKHVVLKKIKNKNNKRKFIALYDRYSATKHKSYTTKKDATGFLKHQANGKGVAAIAVINVAKKQMVWYVRYLGATACQQKVDRFIENHPELFLNVQIAVNK